MIKVRSLFFELNTFFSSFDDLLTYSWFKILLKCINQLFLQIYAWFIVLIYHFIDKLKQYLGVFLLIIQNLFYWLFTYFEEVNWI